MHTHTQHIHASQQGLHNPNEKIKIKTSWFNILSINPINILLWLSKWAKETKYLVGNTKFQEQVHKCTQFVMYKNKPRIS